MYIFTYNDYGGSKEESRELLTRAIDAYQEIGDVRPRRDAGELVASLETTEKGKPYIPGWHHFSISHSGKTWTVLLGEEECGIDVQYEKDANFKAIADRWYTEEEKLACDKGGKNAFFDVWARREACVKAIGESVCSTIPSTLGYTIRMKNHTWFVEDIELLGTGEGCHAAMCTKREPVEVHYFGL